MKNRGISRIFRATAAALAVLMASTTVGTPRVQAMMAPTHTIAAATAQDRAADLHTVRAALENKLIRQRLHDLGLTDPQIEQRVNRLDDQRLHQVAMQIEKQNPAGDVAGILVIAILVVLLVFLIERV